MLRNKFGKKSNKNYEDIHYSCTIRFLDDSEPLSVTFQKDTKGQWLIDHVCKELNLAERDYFGLRYVDSEKQRHWLDPLKAVYRQLKNVHPMVLCFRCKFYPTEPGKLKEEITRYFLFLQLRRDLHHGRLLCNPVDANVLAAYIIQSEVGDYDPQDHVPGYVAQFKMLPKQTTKQEEKIAEIHKTLSGQVPSDSELNFLVKAASLDTYGVDPHPVKDQKGNQMYLGVTHLGIVTFQGNKRTHLFRWPQITKLAFEGKMFIVHVTINEGSEGENSLLLVQQHLHRGRASSAKAGRSSSSASLKKHACGFKCPTFNSCKHLWKCAVEQQYFFTLSNATQAPRVTSGGGLFTRGSKFRFSGRCQREVYTDSEKLSRDEPAFQRSSSNPAFVRSYSQQRTMSLPSKLRAEKQLSSTGQLGEDMSDITIENNHSTDAILMGEDTILAESCVIPEEPEFPEEQMELVEEERVPCVLAEPDIIPQADLDAQIQQLQTELEKCKVESSFQPLAFTAAAAEDVESTITESVLPPLLQVETPNLLRDPADQPPLPAAEQLQRERGVSCCKALTIIFLIVFSVMLLVAFFVLESDLDFPVLKDIRQMPEVEDFKQMHYTALKQTVAKKVGSLFKQ